MTSDDLKDKLGRFSLIDPTITWRTDQFPHREAYDRIEELEAERDEALNQLDSARHSVEVLEKENARLWDALEAYASKLEGHEIECPVLSGNTKKGEPKE